MVLCFMSLFHVMYTLVFAIYLLVLHVTRVFVKMWRLLGESLIVRCLIIHSNADKSLCYIILCCVVLCYFMKEQWSRTALIILNHTVHSCSCTHDSHSLWCSLSINRSTSFSQTYLVHDHSHTTTYIHVVMYEVIRFAPQRYLYPKDGYM